VVLRAVSASAPTPGRLAWEDVQSFDPQYLFPLLSIKYDEMGRCCKPFLSSSADGAGEYRHGPSRHTTSPLHKVWRHHMRPDNIIVAHQQRCAIDQTTIPCSLRPHCIHARMAAISSYTTPKAQHTLATVRRIHARESDLWTRRVIACEGIRDK
jgi:hypothetical protein